MATDDNPNRVSLCVYSQAEGGSYTDLKGHWNGETYEHQQACPLRLSQPEAQRCPCRDRRKVGQVKDDRNRVRDVRVLACLYPYTWTGDEINYPAALARSIKRKFQQGR